jgi:hypothetical protein
VTDLADVMDALQRLAIAAIYPDAEIDCPCDCPASGPPHLSITNTVVNIAQGWPPAAAVDSAMRAGNSLISIYAVPSSTSKLQVPLSTGDDSLVEAPFHGMGAEVSETGFRLYGLPYEREYATAIVDGKAYSVAAQFGDTVEGVAASLAYQIAADKPGATWFASGGDAEVVIPYLSRLIVRIGAPGKLGRIVDRQRSNIMIGVWAPNPSDRAVLGAALKVMVGKNLTVQMPDQTRSIWIAQTENLTDKYENELAFRRDLTVQVQWDTVEIYDAYEVTSVNVRLTASDSRTHVY